jgi:hypothetical protein
MERGADVRGKANAAIACVLLALLFMLPPSWSLACYGASFVLLSLSRASANLRIVRMLRGCGGLLLVGTMLLRSWLALHNPQVVLHSVRGPLLRTLAALFDEQDLALLGAHALPLTSFAGDPELSGIIPALRTSFANMRKQVGDAPTLSLLDLLGAPEGSHDSLRFAARGEEKGAVIFLHGFGGAFTLPCFLVERAASDAGFSTSCPALNAHGDWWSSAGQAIVRTEIGELRARGVKRIVLAGLSNGAVGARAIAQRSRAALSGLLLISGGVRGSYPPGLPLLVLVGRSDRQFAPPRGDLPASSRLALLEGGHFVLMTHEAEAHAAMRSWLSTLTSQAVQRNR